MVVVEMLEHALEAIAGHVLIAFPGSLIRLLNESSGFVFIVVCKKKCYLLS